MRAALQDSLGKARQGTSKPYNLPPPIGGLNTRDSITSMQEDEALQLDNWMPLAGECQLRGGYETWKTCDRTIKTVFQYSPQGGTKEYFAITDANTVNITTFPNPSGPVRTNGYCNGLHITNSAGTTYWWMCNGVDPLAAYSWPGGWIVPAITGIADPTKLIFPWLHKRRIWAIEKDTMNAWFLPSDAIQGAMEVYPFGALFKKGGSLMAGCSWSLDSGAGPDDLFVIITSEGELAVYSGTDPKSASAWSLVGVFDVGRPLGRRCFTKLAGDVSVLLESGLYPMSKLLPGGDINFAAALTGRIQPSFIADVTLIRLQEATAGPIEGWEAILYPRFDALIVNVPTMSKQYVMNTTTGAWCTFSGWTANCFAVFDNVLHFGGEHTSGPPIPTTSYFVYKAWDGVIDDDLGEDITTTAKTAYSYFQSPTSLKHIELLRALLSASGGIETRMGISSDFGEAGFFSINLRQVIVSGSFWGPPTVGISVWDVASWGFSAIRTKFWQNVRHSPGYALSFWLQTSCKDCKLSWAGTDFIVASGGLL